MVSPWTVKSGSSCSLHPHLRIPEETRSFAINASKERFWEPPIRRYVEECLAGQSGIRGKDFNMRWAAAMVADVHRILMRGGIFLYPRDTREPGTPGRTRPAAQGQPHGHDHRAGWWHGVDGT